MPVPNISLSHQRQGTLRPWSEPSSSPKYPSLIYDSWNNIPCKKKIMEKGLANPNCLCICVSVCLSLPVFVGVWLCLSVSVCVFLFISLCLYRPHLSMLSTSFHRRHLSLCKKCLSLYSQCLFVVSISHCIIRVSFNSQRLSIWQVSVTYLLSRYTFPFLSISLCITSVSVFYPPHCQYHLLKKWPSCIARLLLWKALWGRERLRASHTSSHEWRQFSLDRLDRLSIDSGFRADFSNQARGRGIKSRRKYVSCNREGP